MPADNTNRDSVFNSNAADTNPPNVMRVLFRTAAIAAGSDRLGSPVTPNGLASTVIGGFLVSLTVCFLVFIVSAHYARTETVSGQLTPQDGAYKVVAPMSGTIDRIGIRDGDRVERGNELFSISINPTLKDGGSLVSGINAAQSIQRDQQEKLASTRLEQLQTQLAEYGTRKTGLNADISRLGYICGLLRKRNALQIDSLNAHRELHSKGMVALAFMRQQEDAWLSLQQQSQQCERELQLQTSQLHQLASQSARIQAEARSVQAEASLSKAQQREREINIDAQHTRRLSAPIGGTITGLELRPGMQVSAGQTLAVLIPSSATSEQPHLEVELWAPSKAVGFVKAGAAVRIKYDAFPYQTFGFGSGTVRDVAASPLLPSDIPVPLEAREQMFRIRVALQQSQLNAYGRSWTLKPGMRVSADLVLEEQSILSWLLEPLRAQRRAH